MKPKFDISAKNSFTVWESGRFNDRQGFGTSVLVADTDSGPLQVIYDKDPTKVANQFLFYANVGNLLAGSYVKQTGNEWVFNIELLRIDNLITTSIQGHAVPKAETSVLFMCRKMVDDAFDTDKILSDFIQPESLPHSRELLVQAIQKSLTVQEQQKLFYGVPRQKTEDQQNSQY